MISRHQFIAVALALAAASPSMAQSRGSGGQSNAAPATKDAGPSTERAALPAREEPLAPRHGLLGAPGAAPDPSGPSRLGAGAPEATSPSYGEAAEAQVVGTGSPRWQSGDRVRSPSSNDVRLARLQEAPDLEFVSGHEETGAAGKASASAKPQATKAEPKAQGRKGR